MKFLLHLAIFLSAYLFSYLLRFDFSVPPRYVDAIQRTLIVVLIAKSLAFFGFGLFRGWWRYVSIQDVGPMVGGCTVGTALFAGAVALLFGFTFIPRSIYVIDWGITLLLVFGARYLIREARETIGRGSRATDRRVLIVGAGSGGRMIAREIRENRSLGMRGVGFVDDDAAKIGTRIQGMRVLGGHDKIETVCREHRADEIVIAIPSASPAVVRHIVDHCRRVTAPLRILPGVAELIDGRASVGDLRNVRLEDLLSREPVILDTDLLRREIGGQTVMVTGAAGSIGSELCRQVAGLAPAKLVLFEIAETPLFELEQELRERFPRLPVASVIGDIRHEGRVEETIAAHRPTVVYHAAAYKHVPVMELHPAEAVKTNVMGTRMVAQAAARHGVKRFVLVSSDKAVRPANVMGATKRMAELIVENMNGGSETIFVAVRFGNVLDSAGSVIPIFRKQLRTTGKLTVTHPDASRYFMLIPEAVGLILQAGLMGAGRDIFVLDMGRPVKIVDLARNMIRLSGKELGRDAEIVFTGLRPGEKLREELVADGEDVTRTAHPKIMKMIGNGVVEEPWLTRLGHLIDTAHAGNHLQVVRELDALVKGFTPDYRFHAPAEPFAPPSVRSIH